MGMGMMMLPPTVVSLPAKLLVFILADGWGTLITAILSGYR
jgi:flagellar biosynthetic protein FliP